MNKAYRNKFLSIIALCSLSVILLAGIFINELITTVSIPLSSNVQSAPSLLPSLSSELRWGTSEDDEYVASFTFGNDTYLFFNANNGRIEREGSVDTCIEIEGVITKVALTPWGFAIALSRNGSYAIQLFDFSLAPITSYQLNYNEPEVQYLNFDAETLRVGVRHKGTYDFIFTYLQLNSEFEMVYERMIYSVYDISLVKCFELSNKTVIFFNAQYGSVNKSGVSTLYPQSLAVDTSYFSFSSHTLLDVIPTNNGYDMLCVNSEKQSFCANLDENGNVTMHEPTSFAVCDGKFFGNGQKYYRVLNHENGTSSVYDVSEEKEIEYFSASTLVLDCIFVDGSALFAVVKNEKTFLYHSDGISCLILDKPVDFLVLKKSDKVHFFTSTVIENMTVSSLGKKDIYCGFLQ